MLRIRPSVSPLLRKSLIVSPATISRPYLHHSSTKFHRHVLPSGASLNRQFSLFGLFKKPSSTSPPGHDTATQESEQSAQPITSTSESVEHSKESVDHVLPSSSPIELDSLVSTAIQPDTEIVVSLTEQILTPPITFLSHIFITFHDVIPYHSWAFTILFVTISLRFSFRMILESLGSRRSRQLRSAFEPMRVVLASYVRNPQLSSVPRTKIQTVQRVALTLQDRIANHYTPQSANYAPLWARLSQIPVFLGISEALRAMLGCNPGLLGLIFGAWTPVDPKLHSATTLSALYRPDMALDNSIFNLGNLTIPDPSGALPITFAAIIGWNLYQGLISIRNRRRLAGETSGVTELSIGIAIGATACAFTVAKGIPAGLLLFWIANGLVSINLKMLKWFGIDNLGKDLPQRMGMNLEEMEKRDSAKPISRAQREKDFVAPKRRLSLSKKQVRFLADDIMPKKKGGK